VNKFKYLYINYCREKRGKEKGNKIKWATLPAPQPPAQDQLAEFTMTHLKAHEMHAPRSGSPIHPSRPSTSPRVNCVEHQPNYIAASSTAATPTRGETHTTRRRRR
jgi:hypothetical protein